MKAAHCLQQLARVPFGRAVASALGLALTAAAVNVHAASATGNATATVITPIAISNSVDLAFGRFARTAAGTVVISTAGARSATGGVVLSSTGSTQTAASFQVTGDGVATYAITLPAAAATITSGANSMTVDTWTSNPSGTGTLTAGAQTILVGGTLNVEATQATGSYTGTFSVTVEYN